MKGLITSFFTLLLCTVGFAQTVGMSAFGYGKSATGGQGGEVITVSSASDLRSAVNKKKNRIVIITKSITYNSQDSFQGLENVTILGMPGVTLTNLQQNKDKSGIWYVKDSKNVVIRNLTFIGPGAYDCGGGDLLCFDGVTNAWVDHCDFQDGCDGNFDNKGDTDNLTVSWCRFRYLKDPKAGGSGGSDDHRFTNLIGSGSSDKPADDTYNMTWAYCWWDEGCVERMTRARNASLHFLNCYWNSSVAHYYIGPENVDAYVEGCTFASGSNKPALFKSYGGKNGVKYVNSVSTVKGQTLEDESSRKVVVPTYTYTALTADEAKTAVTSTTCGAGATLIVKNDGTVSSACDDSSSSGGEEEKPDTGGTGDNSGTGDTDTSDPTVEGACYSFRPTITSGNLAVDEVVETSVGGIMKVAGMKSETSITYGELGLLLSGGQADSISVWLDNDLTVGSIITVTMTYSKNSKARGVNLLNAEKDVVMKMTQVTDGNDYSFSYTVEANDGLANTRYFCLQRQNSTIIKQVTVTNCNMGTDLPTDIDNTPPSKQVSKFIHEGRLYIRTTDGVVYDITGCRVNITK